MTGGRAISFKKEEETLFLVGTESGMVHLCTTQAPDNNCVFSNQGFF
jgi:hypothetical protein